MRASIDLPGDVEEALACAEEAENSPLARYALRMLVENARLARRERLPLCQDTGTFHLFIDLGEGTALPHGCAEAADEGLRRATAYVPLRSSLVDDPLFARPDRGNNTPVLIHAGEGGPAGRARLSLMAKGGGRERSLSCSCPGEGGWRSGAGGGGREPTPARPYRRVGGSVRRRDRAGVEVPAAHPRPPSPQGPGYPRGGCSRRERHGHRAGLEGTSP